MLAPILITAGIALALIGAVLAFVDAIFDPTGKPVIHASRWPFLGLAAFGVGLAAVPFWF